MSITENIRAVYGGCVFFFLIPNHGFDLVPNLDRQWWEVRDQSFSYNNHIVFWVFFLGVCIFLTFHQNLKKKKDEKVL